MNKNNLKELICYGINGVLTTAVNYAVYFGLLRFHVGFLTANSIAWVFAVIFAFYTNRKIVFRSDGNVAAEMTSFFGLRLITLLMENLLLAFCMNTLMLHTFTAKLAVSIVTVIANYVICKHGIFRKGVVVRG